MPQVDAQFTWTFTGSTAVKKAYNLKNYPSHVTFGIETSSGCTATVEILHRMGSSEGPYGVLESTTISSAAFLTIQKNGPLHFVKPRLASFTSGSTNIVTVYLAARS